MKHHLLLLTMLLASCSDAFDIHPYDVNFKGEKSINEHQIEKIENQIGDKDTLRVAFISDTHTWYTETKAEVAALNKRTDIDFVVHCGDITDTGTSKEFEIARNILDDIRVPYVTLIGNHDFLGTGDQSYQVIYGQMDFSFIVSRIKFVCLNTNATEYDYIAAVPNFDFMETEITKDSALFDRTVLVMHAPPYSDQFNNNVCKAFRKYLDFFPNLMFCVYGHNHKTALNYFYNDDLPFYGVGSAEKRQYRIFTFTKDGYDEEVVDF